MSSVKLQIGDAVQVWARGPVGVIVSEVKTKEWFDRASAQWKTFNFREVLIDGEVIQADPFALSPAGRGW